MCLGRATAHAQMPGQSVRVSGLASPRRVTGAVSRQRAGTGTAFCEVERVTVEVNKVTRLVQVI